MSKQYYGLAAILSFLSFLSTTAVAQVAINNPSVFEGNNGTANLAFTVNPVLSRVNIAIPVTGQYTLFAFGNTPATAGATCGGDVDFIQSSGTFTIPANRPTTTINVTVCGDTTIESDEQFMLVLTNVVGAQCNSDTCFGIGTIRDDDTPPEISISDASTSEPPAGSSKYAKFVVSLSRPYSKDVTVTFATRNRTAIAGECGAPNSDYVPNFGTMTIPAYTNAAGIQVYICGDSRFEPSESFFVDLISSTANAVIVDKVGLGTISNTASASW
jgi:serralysin